MNDRFAIGSTLRLVIANAGWLFCLRLLRVAFAFFVGVWTARYLGPTLWGQLNYAIALVVLFGPITRLGLENVVVHELVRRPGDRDEILGTAFALRAIGGVLSFALALGAVALLRPGDSTSLLLVAIVAFGMVFQAYDVIDIFFQSETNLKYPVNAKSAALALANALKIVFILLGAPLPWFAGAAAIEVVAGAAGLLVAYRLRGLEARAFRWSAEEARRLFAMGWPLILSGTFAVIYFKIDQVMLGQMISQAEVGIYATAARISEMWYFVPVAISTAVFPVLIRSRQEEGPAIYRERTQRLYDFYVWVSLSVAVVMTFAANRIVVLLFGEAYARSGPILAIHIWAGVFIFLREVLGRWFITENMLTFAYVSNGLGALVNVALNLVLIPRYAAMGAAVATVASYATAGYLSCFLHPRAREAARMMSLALVAPLRAAAGLLRGRGRGAAGGK